MPSVSNLSGLFSASLDGKVISLHLREREVSTVSLQHLSVPPRGLSFCFCLLAIAGKFGGVEECRVSFVMLTRIALDVVFATARTPFKQHPEEC